MRRVEPKTGISDVAFVAGVGAHSSWQHARSLWNGWEGTGVIAWHTRKLNVFFVSGINDVEKAVPHHAFWIVIAGPLVFAGIAQRRNCSAAQQECPFERRSVAAQRERERRTHFGPRWRIHQKRRAIRKIAGALFGT